jgi:hypothetical protein
MAARLVAKGVPMTIPIQWQSTTHDTLEKAISDRKSQCRSAKRINQLRGDARPEGKRSGTIRPNGPVRKIFHQRGCTIYIAGRLNKMQGHQASGEISPAETSTP